MMWLDPKRTSSEMKECHLFIHHHNPIWILCQHSLAGRCGLRVKFKRKGVVWKNIHPKNRSKKGKVLQFPCVRAPLAHGPVGCNQENQLKVGSDETNMSQICATFDCRRLIPLSNMSFLIKRNSTHIAKTGPKPSSVAHRLILAQL